MDHSLGRRTTYLSTSIDKPWRAFPHRSRGRGGARRSDLWAIIQKAGRGSDARPASRLSEPPGEDQYPRLDLSVHDSKVRSYSDSKLDDVGSYQLPDRHRARESPTYPHRSTRLAGARPKFAGRPLSNQRDCVRLRAGASDEFVVAFIQR